RFSLMREMACDDLEGSAGHDVLIDHLQGHDFFDVEVWPKARFEILTTTHLGDGEDGSLNLGIEGNLEMKGQSHPIKFEAAAGLTPDGRPAAQATLSIDRTRWGVIYGSGRFFARLAGHLVNDQIDLELKVVV
ncbi:MAG: YceI family protein, partial [Verrucomicrobiota bacterium]